MPDDKNRNVWVYKFRNAHGEVTVHAVLCPDKVLRAGFAFCNPADFNVPHAERVARGQGLALKRYFRSPVVVAENVTLPVDVRRLIQQKLIDVDGMVNTDGWKTLGVAGYNGQPLKDNFMHWFMPFMRDFQDEYYGRAQQALKCGPGSGGELKVEGTMTGRFPSKKKSKSNKPRETK